MQTLIITEADLCHWLGAAVPGDTLVYHRGFLPLDVVPRADRLAERERKELVRVARRAMWAADKGLVHLVQRRHGPEDASYLLIARPRPKPDISAVIAAFLPEPA
jgi:hypothetical protein